MSEIVTVELRVDRRTIVRDERAVQDAAEAVVAECRRRGLSVGATWDTQMQEWVIFVSGERAAVRQLQLVPPNSPPNLVGGGLW